MTFELRLKQLKKTWMEIQDHRESIKNMLTKQKFHKKQVKSLGQLIYEEQKTEQKLLDRYNEEMV